MLEAEMVTHSLPMSEIFSDDEFNCRGFIAPIDVVDLAKSIDQNGLQQPISVQPYTQRLPFKYRIVSGHRRHKAFVILKKTHIPAMIKTGLTDIQASILNFEENLKRKDLNILQEAQAIAKFRNAGMNEQDVASQIGMSRGWVQARFMLLTLPKEIQAEAAAGFLTQTHIRELYTMPALAQFAAVKAIKEARFRNEKKTFIKKRLVSPLTKKARDKASIFEMQDIVRDAVGNNLTTRALGWAAGVVSDFEFYRDLQDYAQENGKNWRIPTEVLNAVSRGTKIETYK